MRGTDVVSKNLRQLMMDRGYTQSHVARASHGLVDQRTVGRILRLETDIKLSTLFALADALKVSPCELLR